MAELQIMFLGMARSPSVEAQIQRWVKKLEKQFSQIHSCTTWIELPHRHGRKGNTFRVRIELGVPGEVLVVSHDPGARLHENAYVAISDAFRAARRQLDVHVRILRDRRRTATAYVA